MDYTLSGTFIESCDCASICPCWVDEEPDQGHCSGLVAWHLDDGSRIAGEPVGGLTVVAVSEHSGDRRTSQSHTALFVDDTADERQFDLLGRAFSGATDGALAELQATTGTVVVVERAQVTYVDGQGDGGAWSIRVRLDVGQPVTVVAADGGQQIFPHDAKQPLALQNTALDSELGVQGAVTALTTASLGLNVAALPSGYLEVAETSGMRGRFSYQHLDAGH